MGLFSRKKINKQKVQLFIQSLLFIVQSDDDFSEEEQNFLKEVILRIRNHYNYRKDIPAHASLSQMEKAVSHLKIEDKRILMNVLMEAAEADKVLKFKELGSMVVIAGMIGLDMDGVRDIFMDKVKEYNLNQILFDEYFSLILNEGKDAADEYIVGKNENAHTSSGIVYCPHCGAENSHENNFCTNCGKKLN